MWLFYSSDRFLKSTVWCFLEYWGFNREKRVVCFLQKSIKLSIDHLDWCRSWLLSVADSYFLDAHLSPCNSSFIWLNVSCQKQTGVTMLLVCEDPSTAESNRTLMQMLQTQGGMEEATSDCKWWLTQKSKKLTDGVCHGPKISAGQTYFLVFLTMNGGSNGLFMWICSLPFYFKLIITQWRKFALSLLSL